jgi:dipeptidyl-peptidase-4
MADPFLRKQAVTQHFTLGQPRSFTVAGGSIFFVRSQGSEDAAGCLWMAEITGEVLHERIIVDPKKLSTDEELPEAERRRRERTREQAGGIVAYSVDSVGQKIAFALGGDLYVAEVNGKLAQCIVRGQNVYDPRMSPNGEQVAYVCDGALKVVASLGGDPRVVTQHEHPDETWGLADCIAAEEMGRTRGFWWAPDSSQVLVELVDNRLVQSWYIGDPSHPASKPQEIKYPLAGTSNAALGLTIFTLDGRATEVQWDTKKYEYLVDTQWGEKALYITVQSRDQKTVQLLAVDTATGGTAMVHELADPQWVELQPGLPCQQADGTILSWQDNEVRQLARDSKAITPASLQLSGLCGTDDDGTIWFTAWNDDPKSWQIYQAAPTKELVQLTHGEGLHDALIQDGLMIQFTRNMTGSRTRIEVFQRQSSEWHLLGQLRNDAAQPPLTPQPHFYRTGLHKSSVALLLPQKDTQQKLPVLINSYGGPHAQLVVSAQRAYLESQWYANQGFAVLVIDGRGTPGRTPAYEKAIAGDLIAAVLEDQITALQEVAAKNDRLDLSRVAIKGWSFGGYLAAYGVVRHPEVFHAAIAGAPVTEWRWYDTHYTERYLGNPTQKPEQYDACSLLKEAHKLTRPLMLIHGLADDNVAFAHTLEMSGALLAAGRPHQVLPLSGATHMPKGAVMAENLEKLQLEFLRTHL